MTPSASSPRFTSICYVPLHDHLFTGSLRRTAHLAAEHGAAVEVFDVVPELPARGATRPGTLLARRYDEHRQRRRQGLESNARQIEDAAVSVVQVVGAPYLEIVRRITVCRHDLLVIADDPGDHGWSGIAKQLLRTSPVPVLLLAPSRARKRRIVAAVDADPADGEHHQLNEEILRYTAAMAGDEADVTLVHAWRLPFESALRGGLYVRLPEAEFDAVKSDAMAERAVALGELVTDRFPTSVELTAQLVEGDPRDVIPLEVERCDATLLVMGTVARTGLRGYLLGNTAEDILDRVGCSVLAVKPPGFEAPLE